MQSTFASKERIESILCLLFVFSARISAQGEFSLLVNRKKIILLVAMINHALPMNLSVDQASLYFLFDQGQLLENLLLTYSTTWDRKDE